MKSSDKLLNLWGRKARCTCGKIVPSALNLGYFEFRGTGSRIATKACKCGFYESAHVVVDGLPPRGVCEAFTPRGGMEFDSYFCGHLSGQ